MKTKILVVEDDTNIRFGLVELLSSEGFSVEACERGDLALAAVEQNRPSLIVLDVMLPGLSGYDVCKQLRAQSYQGLILMLTAKGQEMDKVIGLELGADDYLTKPFGLRELLARVHAMLRRAEILHPQPSTTASIAAGTGRDAAAADAPAPLLVAGDLVIDRAGRTITL